MSIKPDYYKSNGKDLLDRFEEGLLTEDEVRGFYKGNIIKYTVRYKDKNGIEDLNKAKTYIERLTKYEEHVLKRESAKNFIEDVPVDMFSADEDIPVGAYSYKNDKQHVKRKKENEHRFFE